MSTTPVATADTDPWAAWDAGLIVDLTEADARPPLRVAFYGRCSTKELQDPEASRLWQLGNANGLLNMTEPDATIVREFFDVGVSRSLPWIRRPEASRLLAEAKSPHRTWDALIIGETQRCFAADQFGQVEPVLRGQGISILVPELGGPFDDRNSAHDIMMSVHGGLGKAERQKTQDRTKAGMRGLTTQGRHMGGRSPYGYTAKGFTPHTNPRKAAEGYELKRLEPNQAAPAVVRIFEDVLAGKSLHNIATDLNREGILCPSAFDPTRNKHRAKDGWQVGSVRAVVGNLKYTGFQVWGRMKKVEELVRPDDPSHGYETRFVKSDAPPVRSAQPAHEALVSVQVWQEAQAALRGRAAGGLAAMAKSPRARTDGTTQALRGVVHCAHCERKMWTETLQRKSRAKPPREDGKPRRGRKPKPDSEQAIRVRYRCRRRNLVEGSARWENHPTAVVAEQRPVMEQIAAWMSHIFSAEHRDATVDVLTAGMEAPSLVDVRHEQTAARLVDAQKRLDNFIASIGAGVDPSVVGPSIMETQQEIADLQATAAAEAPATTTTRGDVEALVDFFAEAVQEALGPDADPGEVNALFQAARLRIDINGETGIAHAEVHLAPESANPHSESIWRGVNEGVRGGT